VPLGAHAFTVDGRLDLVGFVAEDGGPGFVRGERHGEGPEDLGRALADDLLSRGARALLGR